MLDRSPRVGEAAGSADILFICADPEALVPPATQARLLGRMGEPDAGGFDLLFPVSNESEAPALCRAPSVAYATVSELEEVAAEMAVASELVPIGAARFPVFVVRRAALARVNADRMLADLPEAIASSGGRLAADSGAYVHRYGAMDASVRADLVAKIPAGSRRVLDVGCSQGATAPALRSAGVAEIFGIEPDLSDAAKAAQQYDRVVPLRLDEVREAWDGMFDAVLFGDVLEHLEDPSEALVRVRSWLSPRGRLVASVPNFGNWAVIGDLLRGRFDYVPYSTLSGTHVRFFTRRTLVDLFEACGYAIESIDGDPSEPPPAGRALIEKLRSLPEASGDLAVLEFIVVARRSDGLPGGDMIANRDQQGRSDRA